MKFIGIWYDMESEKMRDSCEANSEQEARSIFYTRKPQGYDNIFLTVINTTDGTSIPDYII